MTVQELIEKTSDLIEVTGSEENLPCDHFMSKTWSCILVMQDNRSNLFGVLLADNLAQQLCPSCRAYYLLQMARNALIEHGRTR